MSDLGEYFSMRQKPRGIWKWILKAPIWLFKAHLGWLFGDRLLVIVHRGRSSGKRYETMIEVAAHDGETGEYIVTSGTGPRADWYLNILAAPAAEIWVRNSRYRHSGQRFLGTEEAVAVMKVYEAKHPKLAARLEATMGVSHDDTEESWRAMMERIPMVGFTPS